MRRTNSIRVYITENCNAQCTNCFNAGIRSDKEISPETFDKLCAYLVDSGFYKIKMMGGEPTTHTQFQEIVRLAQFHFHNVYIFTNALNDAIFDIRLRKYDGIVYNLTFLSSLTEDKLRIDQPGKRTLKIQINGKTDPQKIIETIINLRKFDKKRIIPSFTLDCMSNIFAERENILRILSELESSLDKLQIQYSYDHKLPLCFLNDKKNTIKYPRGICHISNSGLIDSALNIRYCNQYNTLLLNLIQDSKFVPWDIVKNHLLKAYYQQQTQVLDNGCIHCKYYNDYCNGGCWGKNIRGDAEVSVISASISVGKANEEGGMRITGG
jgi:MoaA/NifB/PqqE/SkfB family radical SAM enzyme